MKQHQVILCLFHLLLTCHFFLHGQTSGFYDLRGSIYDANSGEPLVLAHVQLKPGGMGVATDETGHFQLHSVVAGSYQVEISMVGYTTIQIDSMNVGPETRDLLIQLEPIPIEAEEMVVVTAARRAQAIKLAPASVATVSAAEIRSQNLQTFDQAFDGLTGVQVTRSSGANVQALSIRGSSEIAGGGIGNRVLLLIDGRPSLSPESGGALWNLVPLQSVERIEVVKGAYSSLFGSSAMGGVINVITKNPSARNTLSGHLNYGFYNLAPSNSEYQNRGAFHTAELNYSANRGKWKYLLDAGRKHNDGHREKSEFTIHHIFSKLVFQPNERDQWIFSGNFNQISNDAPATWLNSRLAYTVAPHRKDDFQKKNEYSGDVFFRTWRNTSLKYSGRIFYYSNFAFYSFNDDPENQTETNINFGKQTVDEESVYADRIGASLQADYEIDQHYLIGGLDIRREYVNGIPDTVLYGKHRSVSAGIYLQDEISLSKKITATAGIRYDYFYLNQSFDESNISPKISAVWQPHAGRSVRLLFASAFRNPSMAERFIKFEQGGGLRFEPNPFLKAEKLTASLELGTIGRISPRLSYDAALFFNQYRDLISFQQLPDPSGGLLFKVINLNKALMQGAEINFRYHLEDWFYATLGYTFLDARDVSPDRFNDFLAYKVKHALNLTLKLNHKEWSLDLNSRYRSAIREVFIYPGSEPGAYVLVNTKLSWQFSDHFSIYLATDNLNNALYEELERYRMPGRSYTAGLRFNLDTH